jgi:glyoxylase-like metal-dependent hydrolase (beta-lactamase superfamily II)
MSARLKRRKEKGNYMRSRTPGKIRDGLWYLGVFESGVYWLEGTDQAMIISGGLSYIAPTVVEQMKEFGLDEARLGAILILHSHFDHVGVAPFFKSRRPEARIYASERARAILGEHTDTINAFSRMAEARAGMEEACSRYDLEWSKDIPVEPVSEGDVVDLGGVDVRILETPGHSSCSITAYVPVLKALFPSDGGGIPFKDKLIISANSNFTRYQQSLEKLANLDVEYVGADHFGYIYGDEAKTYIARCIEEAASERAKMEKIYLEVRDVDAAAKIVLNKFYAEHPDYFLAPEIFQGVCRQMMRHIAKCFEK